MKLNHDKIALGAAIVGLVIMAWFFVTGCNEQAVAPQPAKVRPPRVQTNPTMSPGVWSIVKDKCFMCHAALGGHAHAGPNINLSHKQGLVSAQLTALRDGVFTQAAPAANQKLTQAELDTIGVWLMDRGITVTAQTIPSTWTWYENTWVSGAANGADPHGHGYYMWAIEDQTKPDSFIVKTYTDRDNKTLKGLAFQNFSQVDQDSFSASDHKVHYCAFAIPYGDRFKTGTITAHIRQDRHMGFFVDETQLEKGGSPYDARDLRTYVRVHFDRDGLHLRSFVAPGLTNELETYPWAGTDPVLTAVSGYTLNHRPAYSAYDDKWYWIKIEVSMNGSDKIYHARIWEDESETSLKWEVKGKRSNATAVHGYVGLFNYTESSGSTKWDMWADIEIYAATVYGSGGSSGCGKCDEINEGRPGE